MGLIDQISGLWRRAQPQQRHSTSDELVVPARRGAARGVSSAFRSKGDDRASVIREARQMKREDPRADALLASIARDAVRGGFLVTVQNGPQAAKAQKVADNLINRLKLWHRLDDYVRLAFRDGDTFLEVAVSEDYLISELSRKPTLDMHRFSDKYDRFKDPLKAFWLGESLSGRDEEPPKDALWFAQWQIIHARWNHDEGERYGSSMFASARTAYKRMAEGEMDVAIRRKTRAGIKYAHILEGASPQDIEDYKERNADVLDDPFAAIADYFFNVKGAIQVVEGDGNIGILDDVLHHIRTWAMASPKPLGLMGYGEQINRDVLEQQQQQYQLALEEITSWTIGELVEPLVHLEWLLNGILPDSHVYEIAQPSVEALTAETVIKAGDAAIKLKQARLPDEFLWPIIAQLLPGINPSEVLAAIKKAAEEQAALFGAMDTDPASRLANELGVDNEENPQAKDKAPAKGEDGGQ